MFYVKIFIVCKSIAYLSPELSNCSISLNNSFSEGFDFSKTDHQECLLVGDLLLEGSVLGDFLFEFIEELR